MCLRSQKKVLLSLNVKSLLKGIQAEMKFCPNQSLYNTWPGSEEPVSIPHSITESPRPSASCGLGRLLCLSYKSGVSSLSVCVNTGGGRTLSFGQRYDGASSCWLDQTNC